MSFYSDLKTENQFKQENLDKIENAASEAIEYSLQNFELPVNYSHVDQDGFLRFSFDGQPLNVDMHEAQKNFDEKFSELIRTEYSELAD